MADHDQRALAPFNGGLRRWGYGHLPLHDLPQHGGNLLAVSVPPVTSELTSPLRLWSLSYNNGSTSCTAVMSWSPYTWAQMVLLWHLVLGRHVLPWHHGCLCKDWETRRHQNPVE